LEGLEKKKKKGKKKNKEKREKEVRSNRPDIFLRSFFSNISSKQSLILFS
jgi:hypothetical protein